MPPPPLNGLAPSRPGSPDLHRGHLSQFDPMERYIFPGWLSTVYGDLGSTQIRTQHCSAQSQTISQLTNVGTMPTRQVPSQFSSYGLLKHLRMGSVRTPHTF
jgi:hypothetical protein